MIAILKTAQKEKHKKGGRKPKLSLEDMLLVRLFTGENTGLMFICLDYLLLNLV
jgi:hypothetical protein